MQAALKFEDVSFHYPGYDDVSEAKALNGINLSLPSGRFVAVIGPNGSGKSTFLRHINGLLHADSGKVRVEGLNPSSDKDLRELRRRYGMVFQNPENQIVGTTVEEDIAFGLENLGVERTEMEARITTVLAELNMTELRTRAVAELSGGQKQKLAIASVLVMEPHGLLLDEVTAMLDPASRERFLTLIRRLMKERHLSVYHVTHHMDEILHADLVLLFDGGRLCFQGDPMECFASQAFRDAGLELPPELLLIRRLAVYSKAKIPYHKSLDCQYDVLAHGLKCAAAAEPAYKDHPPDRTAESPSSSVTASAFEQVKATKVLEVRGLSHRYGEGQSFSLSDLSFDVRAGEIFAVVGPSGAGKSTMVMHFNGLLRKQTGELRVFDVNVGERRALHALRRKVQLLFQFPEHQLFAATIREDIGFGPKQLGLDKEEIDERVREAAERVRIPLHFMERSPFELSGGQKRRVALAGILSMRPQLLILDEPAAGLDAKAKRNLYRDLLKLKEAGVTIILVSHEMDDVSRYADRILVLKEGRIVAIGSAADIYGDQRIMEAAELRMPGVFRGMRRLAARLPDLDPEAFKLEDAERQVQAYLEGRRP